MFARQHAVNLLAIATVYPSFFASSEREVAPYRGSGGQQARQKDVRAEVHMMVPVQAVRRAPIQPGVLIDLRANEILKGAHQRRIENRWSKAIGAEISRCALLVFQQLCGAVA